MSIPDEIGQPDGPSLVLASISASALDALAARVAAARPTALVRRIRGHKARTLAAFFDEIAAALQLPGSFGEGWDALLDCARDLAAAHPAGVVVLVSHAGWLLADAPGERAAFVATIAQLHAEGRAAGRPFQAVLQESPGGAGLLAPFVADR